ncbi:MAG: hypothetical protein QXW79_00615 [Thermoplasmata archaeon]
MNALVDYDAAKPVINYLFRKTRVKGVKGGTDTKRTEFTFFDGETNKVVLSTEVEMLAIYYDKMGVWSWAWSQPGLTNAENYLSKEILLYALKLESDLSYIKSILTTSRGIIRDPTQIDINLAVAASIIKQPYIYPYIYKIKDNYLIYFLILLNKSDLDKIKSEIGKIESEYYLD